MGILWFVGVEGFATSSFLLFIFSSVCKVYVVVLVVCSFLRKNGLHPLLLCCWRGKGCQIKASIHHLNTLDSLRWLIREDSHLLPCFPPKAITTNLGSFFFGKVTGIGHQKSYFWLTYLILFWTSFVELFIFSKTWFGHIFFCFLLPTIVALCFDRGLTCGY